MASAPLPAATDPWHAFLASRGAHVAQGRTVHFGEPQAELVAARDGTLVADLSHNALIQVAGDDATEFLHAQFTNDVQALPEGAAQWSGWCTAKGRLLATFLLLRRRDGYLLMLPAEIAPAIAKRLGMFVLRSKVKIEDVSARFARIGFAGKTAGVMVARHWGHTAEPMRSVETALGTCVGLDANRFVIFSPADAAPRTFDLLAENARPAGADAWEWTSIHAGIPVIVAATQESFVPQMANLDLVGGVSFKKGCYPGQEIVARTQYRGILKRRMALAHADATTLAPGQRVFSKAFGDQAAGEIVSSAPSPDGGADFLVVAQIESLETGDLHLDSPDGKPIEIRRRPAAA
jgi:tRNA-modifying protein YgfZ